MRMGFLAAVFVCAATAGVPATAQVAPVSTRFTITGSPILSQPTGDFARNIGNGFGGGAGVLYHLDRSGLFSVRFDASGVEYGREKKDFPFSPQIPRVHVDQITTNSIIALSFGPEIAFPRGPVRPYMNAGFGGLLFRTTSSVNGDNSSDGPIASTTNYKDSTRALLLGGGVRIPLAGNDPRKAISLDLGLRYYHGGSASYLREGSIQDNLDGTISFIPLRSRTRQLFYVIGIGFRIPHDPNSPCPRLLC